MKKKFIRNFILIFLLGIKITISSLKNIVTKFPKNSTFSKVLNNNLIKYHNYFNNSQLQPQESIENNFPINENENNFPINENLKNFNLININPSLKKTNFLQEKSELTSLNESNQSDGLKTDVSDSENLTKLYFSDSNAKNNLNLNSNTLTQQLQNYALLNKLGINNLPLNTNFENPSNSLPENSIQTESNLLSYANANLVNSIFNKAIQKNSNKIEALNEKDILKDYSQKLDSEINNIKENSENLIKDSESLIKELEPKNTETEEMIKKFIENIKTKESEIEKLKEENKNLEKKFEDKENELKDEISNLEENKNSEIEDSKKKNKEIELLENELEELSGSLKLIKDSLEANGDYIDPQDESKIIERFENHKYRLEELEKSLEENIKNDKKEIEKKRNNAKNILKENKTNIKNLLSKKNILTENLSNIEKINNLKSYKETLENLKKDIENIKIKSNDSLIKESSNSIELNFRELETTNNDLTKNYKLKNTEYLSLKSEIEKDALSININEIQNNNIRFKETKDLAISSVNSLKKRFEDLTNLITNKDALENLNKIAEVYKKMNLEAENFLNSLNS